MTDATRVMSARNASAIMSNISVMTFSERGSPHRPATRRPKQHPRFGLLHAALDVADRCPDSRSARRGPQDRGASANRRHWAATRSRMLVDPAPGAVERGAPDRGVAPRSNSLSNSARGRNSIGNGRRRSAKRDRRAIALVVLAFPRSGPDLPGLFRGDFDRRQRRVATDVIRGDLVGCRTWRRIAARCAATHRTATCRA